MNLQQNTGNENFEWPKFSSDKERIKYNSEKFKNCSIAEAFGLEARPFDEEKFDYKSNDTIYLKIKEITKKTVIFDQGNIKDTIICNVNLYKYQKLRNFIPSNPIPCKIISVFGGKIIVDPFAAMIDEFIENKCSNIELQKNVKLPKPVTVHNLRLTHGGYIGGIVIPAISDLVGENVYFEAFIPGSQIVQNIEYDFSKWEGQSVTAFITNYIDKPNSQSKIFVCSVKEWINFQGQLNLISMFKHYCEDTPEWKEIVSSKQWEGIITGICNSSKKCGVFIEIPSLKITGMVPCERDIINTFAKNTKVNVMITDFDELKTYNKTVNQMQHIEPYIIKDDILKQCNLRISLAFV